MNDTLKAAGRIGAELGAAKAENERLREVLSRIANLPMYQCSTENDYRLSAAKAMAVAALSRQAEPVRSPRTEDTASMDSNSEQEHFTAVDMATAAAQGFRDGQAAVKPAPAQDEQTRFEAWAKTQGDKWLIVGGLQWSAGTDDYASARTNAAWAAWQERAALSARPAQTEQQPIRMPCRMWESQHAESPEYASGYNTALDHVARLNATPIAQTNPQGKFRMGDLVKKSTGSEWVGHVCGTYSTALTPEGYAVESEAHAGSVQIYPAKALEAVDD